MNYHKKYYYKQSSQKQKKISKINHKNVTNSKVKFFYISFYYSSISFYLFLNLEKLKSEEKLSLELREERNSIENTLNEFRSEMSSSVITMEKLTQENSTLIEKSEKLEKLLQLKKEEFDSLQKEKVFLFFDLILHKLLINNHYDDYILN